MENKEGKIQVWVNPTDKIISESTYKQFSEMGDTLLALKQAARNDAQTIAAYKVGFELVVYCVINFTGTFGLNNAENTMIREGILNGDESPMRAILKNMSSLMTDAAMAEMNPAKKKQLEEKFSFFMHLPAVAEFYKAQQAIKIKIAPEVLQTLPLPVQKALTE